MNTASPVKKILVLAANPKDTDKLRLDEEVREIRAALRRSRSRDQFEIITELAVRVDDLLPTLSECEPDIVHFSGHGMGSQGLALENAAGTGQLVSTAALVRLFRAFNYKTECVFLNACYSEAQAEAIYQHIGCVVGMNNPIGDRAAIKFAVGFYTALFNGRSYKDAYELGCTAIDLEGIPESSIPVLKARAQSVTDTDAKTTRVFISYRSQDPDLSLAQQFHDALEEAGYSAFMAAESIRLGERWSERIEQELEQCDYFLLLLSEQSAVSEMVTEEVRRVKQLRDIREGARPTILPIRVNFPIDSPLNYDLRGYLQQIQQREWRSSEDTSGLMQEVLELVAEGRELRDRGEGTGDRGQEVEPAQNIFSLDRPPVPVAEPELPEGQVDLVSAFYVERPPIEARCYEAIAKPGALIRIKAPRQMGKTSLMARILRHAEQQGCLPVPLSFQIADAAVFGDLDRFLKWFCASVGRRLWLPNKIADYWDEIFGSKDNCTAYFEEYLLTEMVAPLALCLDEVDMVFNHPEIASDFFGLLRAWHESAKNSDLWKRLRLVVVHSTEVYIPMNINQSPFNVGLPIELPEFTPEQVQDLAQRHGLNWTAAQVAQLMAMVGGHPFLVRVALYHVAREDTTLEQLLQAAPTEAGLYSDHLRRHLWNLEQRPEMVAAVQKLLATTSAVRLDARQAFQLCSMGLVKLQGNDVLFQCNLYRRYLGDRLGGRGRR